jgi:hypothetical protein
MVVMCVVALDQADKVIHVDIPILGWDGFLAAGT